MKPEIEKIVEAMRVPQGLNDAINIQMHHMAKLLALLAEEQAQAATKMERQTNKLIWLTWALVLLTVGLFFFTVMLYQDTSQQNQKQHVISQHEPKHS